MRSIIAGLAAGVLASAAGWVLLLGYADWLYSIGEPESVQAARRLASAKAEYFARRVEGEPVTTAERAVAINPYLSRVWVDLALEAELSGDLGRAERLLLEAYRHDRTYVPRWSLANFYFRRGDRERFWEWARRAVEMAPHDQSALFDLCWRLSEDGEEIQRKAIPPIAKIQAQYVHFLLRTGRLDAARAAAEELARSGSPSERDVVLAGCDSLLGAGRLEDAVGLWNLLAARRLIPYSTLSPREHPTVVNGDFAHAPLSGGFDWRIFRPPGVAVRGPIAGLGCSFHLSGNQPPSCDLAAQVLVVEGGRRYRLRYLYRTRGLPPSAGLGWRVRSLSSPPVWYGRSEDLCSEDWKEEEFEFAIPPGEQGVNLLLSYERAAGTARIEGTVQLRWIRLEPGSRGEFRRGR